MQKVNQLYGKDIIHQSTGNRIATVRDVVFDAEVRHVVALVVDHGHTAQVVRWGAIRGVGDVIVIDAALPLPASSEDAEMTELLGQANRITGTTIISDGGEQIGTVGDLFIDDHGAVVGYEVKQGLFTDLRGRKFLPAGDVQAVGKDALIVSASEMASVREVKNQDDALKMPTNPPTSTDPS